MNIGEKGRIRAANVIDVPTCDKNILEVAMDKALLKNSEIIRVKIHTERTCERGY